MARTFHALALGPGRMFLTIEELPFTETKF